MEAQIKNIFRHQLWQALAAVFLILISQHIISLDKEILSGRLWGVSTKTWLWIAITIPILHQLYVWLVWRLELYQGLFSNYFGEIAAFKIYKVGFSILFISRLIFIIILAVSSKDSLDVEAFISYSLILFILPFVIYLFYSVKKYFSIDRAFGIDHFVKNYNEPYIKQGIFRYTNNGMYIYGLMILYIPGLLLFSKAALLVAIFNHIYIWVHYYCTERPDMIEIYGA